MRRNELLFGITLLIFPIAYFGLWALLLHLAGYIFDRLGPEFERNAKHFYEGYPFLQIFGTIVSWVGYIVALAGLWEVIRDQPIPRLARTMALSALLVWACGWVVMEFAGNVGWVLIFFLPTLVILTLLHLADKSSGGIISRG